MDARRNFNTAYKEMQEGNYSKAAKLFEKAFAQFEELEEKEMMCICAYELGILYSDCLSDFKKTHMWSEKCLKLLSEDLSLSKDEMIKIKIVQYKHLVLDHDGERAFIGLEDMLRNETLSNTQRRDIYLAIAQYHCSRHNYDDIFKNLKEALDLSDGETDKGTIYYKYGETYWSLGEYEKAKENLEKSEKILKQTNNSLDLLTTKIKLCETYKELGQLEIAIETCESLLILAKKIRNDCTIGKGYTLLAELKSRTGSKHSSLYYDKALEYTGSMPDQAVAVLYDSLATHTTDSEKCDYYQSKSLEHVTNLLDKSVSYFNIGNNHFHHGNITKAKECFRLSLQSSQKLKYSMTDSKDYRISHTDKCKPQYFHYQLTCCITKDKENFLKTSESFRANSLNEILFEHSTSPGKQFSPPSYHEILSILQNDVLSETTCLSFSVYKNKIIACLINGCGEGEKSSCSVEIQQWKMRYNYKTLVQMYQEQRGGKVNHQRAVNPNEETTVINIDEDCTPSRYRAFKNDDRGCEEASVAFNMDYKSLQKHLYQLFISKIEHLISPSARNLVIIPDEFLYHFSFHEFVDGNGKHLFQKYRVRLSPSIHALRLCSRVHDSPKSKVLVIGNPTFQPLRIVYKDGYLDFPTLDGAEEEAKEVASMFSTKAIIGKWANKEYFLSQISETALIHIAAHGIESGELILAQPPGCKVASPSEVLLTSDDLKSYKLKADLVVLSCCLTGCGKITSDGVLNVGRRFLACGAKAVVVTLWNLPDEETLPFMLEFYGNLKRGSRVSEALQSTMKVISAQYPHPKNWAAFQLIGTDVKIDHLFPQPLPMPAFADLEMTTDNHCLNPEQSSQSLNLKDESEVDETRSKLEFAEGLKERGNSHFKEGKFEAALEFYGALIKKLDDCVNVKKVEEGRVLKLAGHLNCAICHLKLSDFKKCIEDCDKALELDSSSEKALYRRGKAYDQLGDLEKAQRDLEECVKLYPRNKQAEKLLQHVINKSNEQKVSYDQVGDLEKAKRDLEECVKLYPKNKEAKKLLQQVINKSKEKKVAYCGPKDLEKSKKK